VICVRFNAIRLRFVSIRIFGCWKVLPPSANDVILWWRRLRFFDFVESKWNRSCNQQLTGLSVHQQCYWSRNTMYEYTTPPTVNYRLQSRLGVSGDRVYAITVNVKRTFIHRGVKRISIALGVLNRNWLGRLQQLLSEAAAAAESQVSETDARVTVWLVQTSNCRHSDLCHAPHV